MWREKNFLTPQITSTFILSVFLSILYLLKFIRLIPYLNLSDSLSLSLYLVNAFLPFPAIWINSSVRKQQTTAAAALNFNYTLVHI